MGTGQLGQVHLTVHPEQVSLDRTGQDGQKMTVGKGQGNLDKTKWTGQPWQDASSD